MATRAIPLVALTVFLFAEAQVASADHALKLPSREVSVVLPLLHFSPEDSAKNILDKIDKILGRPDLQEGGGSPQDYFWRSHYRLKDKSTIEVVHENKELAEVLIFVPGQAERVLYATASFKARESESLTPP